MKKTSMIDKGIKGSCRREAYAQECFGCFELK